MAEPPPATPQPAPPAAIPQFMPQAAQAPQHPLFAPIDLSRVSGTFVSEEERRASIAKEVKRTDAHLVEMYWDAIVRRILTVLGAFVAGICVVFVVIKCATILTDSAATEDHRKMAGSVIATTIASILTFVAGAAAGRATAPKGED